MKCNYYKFIVILLTGMGILLNYSCKTDNKGSSTTEPEVEIKYPVFNKDSAYVYVKTQVGFGPRIPNTEAHKACAAWMADKFRSFGADVIEQKFQVKASNGTDLNGINVIAQFNPSAKRRIVLAAHWDTRPWADADPDPANRSKSFDSADDGPSGVGVLIEIGRNIQLQPLNDLGIDIVLFDLEDYGEENKTNSWGLGSQYWSSNLHVPGYKPRYGILLDMVGGSNPGFYREDYSVHFAKAIVDKVWSLADIMGYGAYFKNESGGGVVDDHYFVNTIAKIKMIDIINKPDGQRFPHYHHTLKDNMDVIDPNTLNMVGRLMIKLIYQEDAGVI